MKRRERLRRLAPGAYESRDGRFYMERTIADYKAGDNWVVRDESIHPPIETTVYDYNTARDWMAERRRVDGHQASSDQR